MLDLRDDIQQICQRQAIELPRRAANELHFVVEDGDDLVRLCRWASQQDFYLCTMVANDERFLEDHTFKLYYVLSAPRDRLVILEYPLSDPTQYPSIRESFPAVEPLEREILDLFGLTPDDKGVESRSLLHAPYPDDLYPLRPRRALDRLKAKISQCIPSPPAAAAPLPTGMVTQVVGPIHAAVIEAGQFSFDGAGELVEQLSIRHGYKHRGIEKLFETHYTLENGWQLAERVSGDSSFSHALTYCRAVEALARIAPPEPALCWRALFLELERLYNHIGTVAALVHDIVLELIASELAVLRERAMRLNRCLSGSRLLRGVNRPGGVEVHPQIAWLDVLREVRVLTAQFLDLGALIMKKQSCRDRLMGIGMLTASEARETGATGLMARAAGLWDHDFRLRHDQGVHTLSKHLAQEICRTIAPNELRPSTTGRRVPIFRRDLRGDVFARLLLRIAEVETSAAIIEHLVEYLSTNDREDQRAIEADVVRAALRLTPNFEFGLGYVESGRGDIFYWLMKGPGNTIRRCKVRDPSVFNWHAFRRAVIPETDTTGRHEQENILPDFPLINRSCDLSYAGRDG